MYWANFLHIYQPPTQKEIWVKRITDECYRKVFKGLLEIPRARLTLNINGILCEFLEKYGGQDVLANIKTLLKNGNLELTGSAKYHAFLPLLPEAEIERQIHLNEIALDKYFGDLWRKEPIGKRGFFSPEMAYSEKVAKVAAKMGYKWMIIDELALPSRHSLKTNAIATIPEAQNFGVFFRERNVSFTILSAQAGTMPTILRYLGDRVQKNEYLVTAMDGETFGHHRPGLENLLFELLQEKTIEPATLTDLLEKFPERYNLSPRNSTWAVTKQDLKKNTPFARWKGEQNPIQQSQWELTNLAIDIVHREGGKGETRSMLDEALHSDQYWWASAKPWWSLEMIERGAFELKSIIHKNPTSTEEEKKRAEELYKNIIYTGFEWQRIGLVDELSREENDEIRERLEEKEKLFITKEEYQRMIRGLTEQMKLAAKNEEYHRASMIKDRIRELEEEMNQSKNS